MAQSRRQKNRTWLQQINERYAYDWQGSFTTYYTPLLQPSMTILDVGSGRRPLIPAAARPEGCSYIGLDVSKEELNRAPNGAYDQQYVQDLAVHVPGLDEQVDLAVSWQVLEHIDSLTDAVANVQAYLRPNGHFVSLLSGRNAHFAVINRFVPEKLGVSAMHRLLGRPPDSVFRAPYDNCTFAGLSEMFQSWRELEIIPIFRGAGYFSFFKPAAMTYLKYENWAARNDRRDLATHYIVVAHR